MKAHNAYAPITKVSHRDLPPRLHAGSGPGDAALRTAGLREAPQSSYTDEFIDQVGGTAAERPALDRLWQAVRGRKLDTILVWKFDRFARSTKQLIDALEECRHLGVDFISITQQIDTSSPMGKAIFTVISVIAESERVRAGIAKARANGTPHGRPKIPLQTIQEIRWRRRQGRSLNQIARQLDISHQTVANYAPQRRNGTRTS